MCYNVEGSPVSWNSYLYTTNRSTIALAWPGGTKISPLISKQMRDNVRECLTFLSGCNRRSCKHLREYLGDEYETARVGRNASAPVVRSGKLYYQICISTNWCPPITVHSVQQDSTCPTVGA